MERIAGERKFPMRILTVCFVAFIALNVCGCHRHDTVIKMNPESEYKPVKQVVLTTTEFAKDFGTVRHGDILRYAFLWQNTSAKAIKVSQVSTSCSCIKAEVKKWELAPGESTDVNVEVNTQGYNGGIKQMAFVSTDDLDNPVRRFIIKAEVVK
jgi:hypothetical protein